MKLKYATIFAALLFVTIFLSACNNQTETDGHTNGDNEEVNENTLMIYTTLYPLEDFAKKIGGEYVHVESIMPPGSDSHTYEPTSKEMVEIARADAFIYNGLGMEPYADKISSALKNEDVILIEATRGLEETEHHHEDDQEEDHHDHGEDNHEDHGDHNHGDIDPHVWLDPYQALKLAENIKHALIELKPEATVDFEKNYESLQAELEDLDKEFHQLVESKTNPEMIVSHAAYGYWEETYGIHQIPITGISSSDEPSQKELIEIINLASEKEINYIVFEQNVTPKVAEVVQSEINAEAVQLHNLSVLTDEDIEHGDDYFSLMRRNLEVLDKVLK